MVKCKHKRILKQKISKLNKQKKLSKNKSKNDFYKFYLKNRDFLNLLNQTKNSTKRKVLIDIANKGNLEAVCQCVRNVLKGNIKLNDNQFNKLKRYKKVLRLLSKKQTSQKKKKNILKQHGGFLRFLIPAIIGGISSLFGNK